MKNKISDIFFDLDDTLWDFQRNSYLTFAFILEKRQLPVHVDTFFETYKPINETYWTLYRRGKIDKTGLRLQRLSDTFNALNLEVSEEMIRWLADDYMMHLADNNHLLPQTKETLEYLIADYNLHIITNGFDEVQAKKLKNAQIRHYFKTVTTSDEAGVKKPDPLIFDLALQKSKALKEQSLMIGDNFEADVLGAEKAGWMSVYVNPFKREDRSRQITTIHELKTWL